MPERSEVPYGSGVFLRARWAALQSVQAELAVAAYCGAVVVHWLSDQRLSIHCELLEGEPHIPGAVLNGTSIEVFVQRQQAAKFPP
jgi:hypothetical protein